MEAIVPVFAVTKDNVTFSVESMNPTLSPVTGTPTQAPTQPTGAPSATPTPDGNSSWHIRFLFWFWIRQFWSWVHLG
jgi:hypothetical protein